MDKLNKEQNRKLDGKPAGNLVGKQKVPLCVDLDGTLVLTDTLFELLFALIKQKPLLIFCVPLWIAGGKANLKYQLSKHVSLDVKLLPYHVELLEYLAEQKSQRPIVLVTGSHQNTANAVSEHLGLFSEVLASDANINLTGKKKAAKLIEKYGEQGFAYIGNDKVDWPVWSAAEEVLVVAPEGKFLAETKKQYPLEKVFSLARPSLRDYLKAIRVHQWLKNMLIFIPLALDHRLSDWAAGIDLVFCFFCLSLLASSTYIINDLLDLEADRENSTKRKRAFAAGLIQPQQAILMIVVLLSASLLLSIWLPLSFLVVLLAYFVATLSYSLVLKKIVMVDVCVLALLFTLRIIGGAVAITAESSFWLLAFSMFFFLSLALGKRVSELTNAVNEDKYKLSGRGYNTADLPLLSNAGITAGYVSVLIVALYINSDKVNLMYDVPEIIWLVCPLLLYWVGRFWLIVSRGKMHEDPIIFAMRDRISLIVVALCGAIVLVASLVGVHL